MKRILRRFHEIFSPKELQQLDAMELVDAMNDPVIRKHWLHAIFEELKRLNLEMDQILLRNEAYRFPDLAARRKAFQDALELILSAKRGVLLGRNHNQAGTKVGQFDLDSVTVDPAPR